MSEPPEDARARRARDTVRVILAMDPLSDLPRTGWLLRGVRPCESIADHSFGVALLVMRLIDATRAEGTGVDGERALRMALLHDAPEARLGDIPSPVKSEAFDRALGEVERAIVASMWGADECALLEELERGTTLESRIVRVADKAHMLAKAIAYERAGRRGLEGFWERASTFDPRGIPAADALFDALCEASGRGRPRA